MTVTRLVIGDDSTGGVAVTIVGNTFFFPAVYGGPRTGSYLNIYNIDLDEYDTLTSLTPHPFFFNAFSDASVASIKVGWNQTHKYALTRTQLASPTFVDHRVAVAAITQDDEEVVVLPSSETKFGFLPLIWETGITFDFVLRGWSPQQKPFGFGNSDWSVRHEADLVIEDFIVCLASGDGMAPRTSTTTDLSWEFNRIQIYGANSHGFIIPNLRVASGFVLTCNSCIATCSSGLAKDAFRIDDVDATLIVHNCIGAGTRAYRRLGGTFRAFNSLAHFMAVNSSFVFQFDGSFDAASDFNAAQNATAPGPNSQQNRTLAQIGMAWNNSPARLDFSPVGLNSQYPFDFRTVDAPGGSLKDNGNTFAGSPGYDFNGFKCPTGTGNARTIGACNFSTNNGGVAWPGFGSAVGSDLLVHPGMRGGMRG